MVNLVRKIPTNQLGFCSQKRDVSVPVKPLRPLPEIDPIGGNRHYHSTNGGRSDGSYGRLKKGRLNSEPPDMG